MSKEVVIDFDRRAFIKSALFFAGGAAMASCNYPANEGKTGNLNFPKGIQEGDATEQIPEPSAEPSLTPSETPTEEPFTYFEKYLYPALYDAAQSTRFKKAEKDPDYWDRVDKKLNEDRINFVLLGIGSEGILTDSIQIMSLKRGENEVRSITLNRDTEAPEIRRFKGVNKGYRVNQAHAIGGMPLAEQVLQDATGLAADYVVVLDMDVLPRAVEKVFGNRLEVCIPWEIDDAMMGYFPAGLQELDGEEVLRASRARYYGSNENRNTVQQYVLRAMLRRVREEISGGPLKAAGLLTKGYLFYDDESSSGEIKTNFDRGFFADLVKNLIEQVAKGGEDGKAEGFGLPSFLGRYHIKAENAGDTNDRYRKKPLGGNPQAQDLVSGYWASARQEVRDFLLEPLVGGFEQELAVCGIANE